jgi:hypothetical protein
MTFTWQTKLAALNQQAFDFFDGSPYRGLVQSPTCGNMKLAAVFSLLTPT